MGGEDKAEEMLGGETGGGAIGEEEQNEKEKVLLTTGPLGQSAMGMISL